MTDRELMQLALEALEHEAKLGNDDAYRVERDALRAAIEQAQKPVAWMHKHIENNVITHRPADLDRYPDRWEALYKTPPPCQTCQALARTVMMDQTSHDVFRNQWQGLTEEEKQSMVEWRTPISSRRLSLNLKRGIHERFRSGTHKDGGRHSRSRRVCLGVQLRSLPNQVRRMEGNI